MCRRLGHTMQPLAQAPDNTPAQAPTPRTDIKSLSLTELVSVLQRLNQPAYRAHQILTWIYKKCANDWQSMTDLPAALREQLHQMFTLRSLDCLTVRSAADGTRKFLWRLTDGHLIESVLLTTDTESTEKGQSRLTACISSQVGCAYRCRFCASGMAGFRRNLLPHEIVDQVLAIESWLRSTTATGGKTHHITAPGPAPAPKPKQSRMLDNIVVMGMGEPLANYDNVLSALKTLNSPTGFNIGARRITISTCGIVPGIKRLAHEPYQFELAISLHAANDKLRDMLMPVNKEYPLQSLIEACRYYQQQKRRIITFEYLLIANVNDTQQHAAELVSLLRDIHAKVNLIPYNPVPGLKWERPTPDRQQQFLSFLQRQKIPVTLRKERGTEIEAACGQLRLRILAHTGQTESIQPETTPATPPQN